MAQQLSTATTGRSVLGFFGVLLMSGVNFGGLKRRGLGPRNNVLTTCKAVTQRGIIRYNKYV